MVIWKHQLKGSVSKVCVWGTSQNRWFPRVSRAQRCLIQSRSYANPLLWPWQQSVATWLQLLVPLSKFHHRFHPTCDDQIHHDTAFRKIDMFVFPIQLLWISRGWTYLEKIWKITQQQWEGFSGIRIFFRPWKTLNSTKMYLPSQVFSPEQNMPVVRVTLATPFLTAHFWTFSRRGMCNFGPHTGAMEFDMDMCPWILKVETGWGIIQSKLHNGKWGPLQISWHMMPVIPNHPHNLGVPFPLHISYLYNKNCLESGS